MVEDPIESALENRPEVLDILGVDGSPRVLDFVVNHLVGQMSAHAPIGWVTVSHQDSVSGVHILQDDGPECIGCGVGHDGGIRPTATALNHPEHGGLVLKRGSIRAGLPQPHLLLILDALMVGRVSPPGPGTNIGLIGFHDSTHTVTVAAIGLHGLSNSVAHEPCGLVADTEVAVKLVS